MAGPRFFAKGPSLLQAERLAARRGACDASTMEWRPFPRLAQLLSRVPPRARWPGLVLALVLGTLGGALASLIGVPLPWMLGPMLACAVACLSGVSLIGPVGARPVVVPVLGVMLGSGFTPEIVGELPGWAGTFALLPPFTLVAGTVGWVIYRKLGGYDARTAFFCAAPGGLNEMIIMGAEAGADERRIALTHAVRVFAVIALVAVSFALIEGTRTTGMTRTTVGFADLSWGAGAALLACAVFGPWLARRARMPAAPLLGPMLLSAALHLSGLVQDPPPALLVIIAQVVIGTVLGCRFAGATFRDTGREIALAGGAAVAMLIVTGVFAGLAMTFTGVPWSQAVLAYAPGGLAEMSLLALAKEQDVAYVATAHVARIVLVLFAVRPVFALLAPQMSPPEPQNQSSAATPDRD